MSEIYDNTDILAESQRNAHFDTAFPLQDEGVPTDEESDLETTYNQLTLHEKLKDNRWQLRRKAYMELYQFFETGQAPSSLDGDELKPESMVPWIQNMINEHNMIALVEALKALNAFLTYHTCSRPQLASFTGPLMDKLVLTKKNIQGEILDILDKLIEGEESNSIPQEILKRLDNKNFKFLNQLLHILLKYVKRRDGPDDVMIRTIFKSMLPLVAHSNKETRQLAFEILKVLYSYIEEPYKEIKEFAFGNLRHVHLKELETLQKTPKAKGRRLVKLNDGSFKIPDGGMKKPQPAQKVDLMNLLPEKYLEVPYLVQGTGEKNVTFNQNEKKKKLEEFNQRIEQIMKNNCEVDVNKDYSNIINLLILMLEDKNILINNEAIKSVDYLVKILKNNFSLSKLKHILTLIIEKLDAKKKTAYNTMLIQVLDDCIIYHSIIPETLCDILLYHAESNKNMNVRTSCLNWFETNLVSFLTDRRDALYANMARSMDNPNRDKENVKLMASVNPAATLMAKTLTNKAQAAFTSLEPDERMERLLTVVYKKIQQIHKKEGNIPLKKKCQQVVESLENLYTRAAVITEPNKEDDRGTGLADISSIRGNSRMMANISNLSLHQGDLVYEELKESDDEDDEDDENILEQAKTNRDRAAPAVAEKKGEFAFENMKPAEKEQFGKIAAMFKDIRTQDEHASEKLESITGFIEKANMEVVQACQGRIVKMLKKALMGNATDPRNMLRVFEAANNLLIKLNKICLEILPETLNTELKTILLLLSNVLNTKSIEKTLDAMYMTCPLENFLKVTLFLFEKVDTKYIGLIPEAKLANALRIYLNWLVLKVEKLQDVLLGESALKDVENGFSQFRFSNLPQVHLGLVNILSKKLKKVEQSMIAADQSMRSYETPRSSRRHMKNLSIDPHSTYGKDDIGGLNVSIRETNNFSNKLKNIQEQAKNDSRGGLEKFNSLLSSFKKKNMDRLNLSSSISPQVDSVSPGGRHWKRGLGREGTPLGGDLNESMRGPRALSSNKDKENKFFTSATPGTPGIDISDITTTLVNSCNHLTDKDLPIFETTLSKVRSMYQPKEVLQVINSISQKLFLKGCFGSRIKAENILGLLHKHLEDLDKHAFFRTMKAFFCMKSRENDHETVHNIAKGCLELALAFYRQTQLPHKLVSAFVEMIVYALTDLDLRPSAEEALELISKSIGRESLRKIFEIELIHSAKMYQIFLYWADQQQSFGNSPISKHEQREPSPVPRKDEIYVEQNETHVLHDDSFNNSFTPQRPTNNNKRNSHSFDQVLEQAANDQDMNQLSEILMHDEKEGEIIDGPNFGYNVRGTDTELSKGTLESRMGTIEKNLQYIDRNLGTIERNMGSLPSLTAFERQEIPSLSQFGDSVGPFVLNELGTAQKEPIHIQREEPPQFQMHPPQQNMRQVLGEKRFGEPQNILQNVHTMNPIPQRNLVMPQQSDMFNKEDKENLNQNLRGREEFQTRATKRDDSADKWKEKYLQEKTRLQGTIDLLEKANQGYFTQVTEKSDLVGKLNQQRQINEDLLNKFNMLSEENEKLKKETIAFEIERERASTHHSLMLNSTFFHNTNKMDVKKLRHQKFIQEALPIAAKGQGKNKEEFIKQFQEVLLTSDSLEYEMGETLMRIYEDLEEYGEKVQFVINLKTSVAHPQVMGNLSVQNHKFLLEIALKLCISENTQKEILLSNDGVTFVETDLTNEMQLLLDGLLRFHSVNATLTNLLRILSDSMPVDFNTELTKGQKMMLKLTVKCLVKLSGSFKSLVTEDVRVFDVLIEIYKLFKLHPPETLKEDQPNIKDFDVIYRNIRTLADHVIDLGPHKAKEFTDFFSRENNKSIFLEYIKSYVAKYYPNITHSHPQNMSHMSNVSYS